jgi:hypothetical protein
VRKRRRRNNLRNVCGHSHIYETYFRIIPFVSPSRGVTADGGVVSDAKVLTIATGDGDWTAVEKETVGPPFLRSIGDPIRPRRGESQVDGL